MRNQNPKTILMNLCDKTPLMRYSEEDNFSSWQKNAKEKLCELLGLDVFLPCDDNLKFIRTTEYDGYKDTYFTFQSEPDYYVPCHILIPDTKKEKNPVLLCLQGHSTGMHISIGLPKYTGDEDDISSGDRDYARIAVKKGYVAIAIEQRYMGECGGSEEGPGCRIFKDNTINALPTLLFGRTAIGERVHDIIKLIDVITSEKYDLFNCIDKNNIMVTGNSGGGTTSFYLGCVDERIKITIPSCSVCTYKDSIVDIEHCGCNYIPSIAKYFDMCDLAGLIAPRGLIIVAGKNDKIFPLHAVKKTYNFAKELFKKAGQEEKIELLIGDGGHRYYADSAFSAIENMNK